MSGDGIEKNSNRLTLCVEPPQCFDYVDRGYGRLGLPVVNENSLTQVRFELGSRLSEMCLFLFLSFDNAVSSTR